MYAKNLENMHKLVSEQIGKIQGIVSSESFIEMKTQTKQLPFMSEL